MIFTLLYSSFPCRMDGHWPLTKKNPENLPFGRNVLYISSTVLFPIGLCVFLQTLHQPNHLMPAWELYFILLQYIWYQSPKAPPLLPQSPCSIIAAPFPMCSCACSLPKGVPELKYHIYHMPSFLDVSTIFPGEILSFSYFLLICVLSILQWVLFHMIHRTCWKRNTSMENLILKMLSQ